MKPLMMLNFEQKRLEHPISLITGSKFLKGKIYEKIKHYSESHGTPRQTEGPRYFELGQIDIDDSGQIAFQLFHDLPTNES